MSGKKDAFLQHHGKQLEHWHPSLGEGYANLLLTWHEKSRKYEKSGVKTLWFVNIL